MPLTARRAQPTQRLRQPVRHRAGSKVRVNAVTFAPTQHHPRVLGKPQNRLAVTGRRAAQQLHREMQATSTGVTGDRPVIAISPYTSAKLVHPDALRPDRVLSAIMASIAEAKPPSHSFCSSHRGGSARKMIMDKTTSGIRCLTSEPEFEQLRTPVQRGDRECLGLRRVPAEKEVIVLAQQRLELCFQGPRQSHLAVRVGARPACVGDVALGQERGVEHARQHSVPRAVSERDPREVAADPVHAVLRGCHAGRCDGAISVPSGETDGWTTTYATLR